jgi:amino acid adenylation domain-containing protein
MSFSPLFQVVFTLQNPQAHDQELSSLMLSPVEADSGIAKFDLTLSMIDQGEKLGGSFEYNTNLFDETTIQRMIKHFRMLLQGIVSNPEQRIADISILTESEKQMMVVEWNQTYADFPYEKCVHEWFELQAKKSPEAIAVRMGDRELSYFELNRKANKLAHYLQRFGIGPETAVAICFDRSIEMIIGQLGILKAGGAFVPMDPAYPVERLAFILEDTKAPILLVQRDIAEKLQSTTAHTILLDDNLAMVEQESDQNPISNVSPNNLAYMIYTSGSTGKPKGTLLRHQGLCNFINFHIRGLEIKPGSRVLQFASFSFDASLAEIFTALLSGSTLQLVKRETLLSIQALHNLLQEQGITLAIIPPSILKILPTEGLDKLQILISAGEGCPNEVARRWSIGRKFYNGYGPTEASIGPAYYLVDGLNDEMATIPIGRPIDNIQIYVLDSYLNPVPIGVSGQLFISGVGLARGYYDRSDLTAEKFIPNPFSEEPGARMYKTGDLARFLADGNIEFLGRIDHQVKIRSFRIEVGEIEKTLIQHPHIVEAVVLAREDKSGDKRLVAYIVPGKTIDSSLEVRELRSYLSDKLPDYMIPAAFVKLDAIPLTPNGKVDRKALPEPDEAGIVREKEFVAPRDEMETKLAQIWEEVLNHHPIGVKDNFFELGGHSLLAIHLLGKIQNDFEQEIPLVALFKEPTIEHLANMLRGVEQQDQKSASSEKEIDDSAASSLVVFHDNNSKPPVFMVHPSGGSVHWYADLARQIGPDQPFYGIQARGIHGEADPHTEIKEMAAFYVDAIKSRQAHGPYMIGSWSMGIIIAYEIAQQMQRMGEKVALLAMFDQGPFLPNEVPKDSAEFLQGMFNGRIEFPLDTLRQMEYEDQLKFVLKTIKKANMISKFVRLSQFRKYVEVLRSQMDAWTDYKLTTYPGKVALFRSSERDHDDGHGWDLGWNKVALGGVEVHEVPGNHNTMLHEPHVVALAARLKECIEKVMASDK